MLITFPHRLHFFFAFAICSMKRGGGFFILEPPNQLSVAPALAVSMSKDCLRHLCLCGSHWRFRLLVQERVCPNVQLNLITRQLPELPTLRVGVVSSWPEQMMVVRSALCPRHYCSKGGVPPPPSCSCGVIQSAMVCSTHPSGGSPP